MTTKAAFNAEEWSIVAGAPVLAAMAVMASDRGGSLRESISLARAYTEARQDGHGELVRELVAAPPTVDAAELRSADELRTRARQRLRDALALVSEKATPDEAEDYKAFVRTLAETVAHAHKEGGVLGIGGKEVSPEEQQALDEIDAELGGSA